MEKKSLNVAELGNLQLVELTPEMREALEHANCPIVIDKSIPYGLLIDVLKFYYYPEDCVNIEDANYHDGTIRMKVHSLCKSFADTLPKSWKVLKHEDDIWIAFSVNDLSNAAADVDSRERPPLECDHSICKSLANSLPKNWKASTAEVDDFTNIREELFLKFKCGDLYYYLHTRKDLDCSEEGGRVIKLEFNSQLYKDDVCNVVKGFCKGCSENESEIQKALNTLYITGKLHLVIDYRIEEDWDTDQQMIMVEQLIIE